MAALDRSIASMSMYPSQILTYSNLMTRHLFINNIIYSPPNILPAQRTVLIPNMTVGADPTLIFPGLIDDGVFFRMILARTSKIKFMGRDGKADEYGRDTVLIVFGDASYACDFALAWKERGAVLLVSATNPCY